MPPAIVDDVVSIRKAMERLHEKPDDRPIIPDFAINAFIQKWWRADVIVRSPFWHPDDTQRVPEDFQVDPIYDGPALKHLQFVDRLQTNQSLWLRATKMAYFPASAASNHGTENTSLVLIRLRALQLI